MAHGRFASYAWLLRGLTVSVPGWLESRDGRLRFTTSEGTGFDVALPEVTHVIFPWYYFGGGVKLRANGTPFRISFVRPNGAEYAEARAMASFGDPRAILAAASKLGDIRTGRNAGRRWRELLEGPSAGARSPQP